MSSSFFISGRMSLFLYYDRKKQYDSVTGLVLLGRDGGEDDGSWVQGVQQSFRGAVQPGFGHVLAAAAG